MQKSSLTALARQLSTAAAESSAGRKSSTVFGGHEKVLRQVVIALASGQRLEEHDSPGDATLQVLTGRVRLTSGEDAWDGAPGDLIIIPPAPARHAVEALEDSAFLLNVAKRG